VCDLARTLEKNIIGLDDESPHGDIMISLFAGASAHRYSLVTQRRRRTAMLVRCSTTA
jgi:hypothetical protein